MAAAWARKSGRSTFIGHGGYNPVELLGVEVSARAYYSRGSLLSATYSAIGQDIRQNVILATRPRV